MACCYDIFCIIFFCPQGAEWDYSWFTRFASWVVVVESEDKGWGGQVWAARPVVVATATSMYATRAVADDVLRHIDHAEVTVSKGKKIHETRFAARHVR